MFQDFTLFTQNTVTSGCDVRGVWMKPLSFWTITEVICAGRKTCAPLSHTYTGEIWKNKRCGMWQYPCVVHAKKVRRAQQTHSRSKLSLVILTFAVLMYLDLTDISNLKHEINAVSCSPSSQLTLWCNGQ